MLTVEKVDTLIQASRPKTGPFRGVNLILLGLAVLLGASLADPDLLRRGGAMGFLLPQVLVVTLVAIVFWAAMQQRRRSRLMLEAFEAVQLREWSTARRALARLLRRPVRPQAARAESLIALASVAEVEQAHETAQHIYEVILAERSTDPIQTHTTRVALAAAMLRTGQTSDAVDLVDQLERAEVPEPLQARVEMLALYREIVMGQAQHGLGRAGERRRLFRKYSSTRAGFGYGLLAAAFDRANRPAEAQRHWHDATLLVRPAELTERFSELAPVAARYSAAEWVL